MNVRITETFFRDLKKITDKNILTAVRNTIEQVRSAQTTHGIAHFRKLAVKGAYYRIRIRDHRIGLELDEGTLIFHRILERKDIYRYFP